MEIKEDYHIPDFAVENKEKLNKIKKLEEEANQLKEELIREETEIPLLKKELKENFKDLNIEDLKLYIVFIQNENLIEDSILAILKINGSHYPLIVEDSPCLEEVIKSMHTTNINQILDKQIINLMREIIKRANKTPNRELKINL